MVRLQRLIPLLALCASFFALGVIGLGAFTRLIDGGLGCPDWPGCYGHLTVPLSKSAQQIANLHFPATPLVSYKAWAEMIHRYFAGCLSLLILSIVLIISKKPFRKRSNIILAIFLVALLAYQIILGQLTVTLKLLPIVVTQHLLGGFFILATLWLIYLNNKVPSKELIESSPTNFKSLLPWAGIALIILLTQIILGVWTSANYASLSCPDFPFCTNNQSIAWHFKEAFNLFAPIGINYDGGILSTLVRQTIQMTHRLGALIITVYLLSFAFLAMPKLKNSFELLKPLLVILILLGLQLCIGITNVIFKLPLVTAISHTLIAALLLLSLITFIFKLAHSNHRVFTS